MKIPTLGSPQIWHKLAPRLVKYLKPKLGRISKPNQSKPNQPKSDIIRKEP